MSKAITFELTKDATKKRFETMLRTTSNFPLLWKRVGRPIYLAYQLERWRTEGFGEWKKLSPEYKKKKERDSKALRGGQNILLYTGALVGSATKQNNKYREVVSNSTVIVSTSVVYAARQDKDRPFTNWDKKFRKDLKSKILAYMK